MKDLKDWAAVQRTYEKCGSKNKTSKILQMSPVTVRKLLNMTSPPKYHRSSYPSKMDMYLEQIIEWRCEPYSFNGTRIFKELKKIGYDGSIGPLYRKLKVIDEDIGLISSKATVRIETPPGDQAQFDWSPYSMVIGGVERVVYCFTMILAASRKKAIVFSLRQDSTAIYEAIQDLFDQLGGVTLELLIDNPKSLVIENNPKSEEEIRYHPEALMVAKRYGVELNACPVFWARKKGKIERPYQYIEEQFIKGNTFESMEELNKRGREFIDEWCDEVHGTTKRIPNEHYLIEEKSTLNPLPKEHYYHEKTVKRHVSLDSFISFNGNKYSVPVEYADKDVLIRHVYGWKLKVYDKKENFILDIETFDTKKMTYRNDEHYAAIAPPVSTSIPQIRRDFTARFTNGAEYLSIASNKFQQPTHHARRIMEYQSIYDDETLDRLIRLSIDEDKMDITSFRELLRDYNRGLKTIDNATEDKEEKPSLTRNCSYYDNLGKE